MPTKESKLFSFLEQLCLILHFGPYCLKKMFAFINMDRVCEKKQHNLEYMFLLVFDEKGCIVSNV